MDLLSTWITMLFKTVKNISEPVQTAVKETVTQIDKKAQQTPNPWDNMLVELLKAVLFVKDE